MKRILFSIVSSLVLAGSLVACGSNVKLADVPVEDRTASSKQADDAAAAAVQGSRSRHEVGMLWLGEEFAQLETAFCDWKRSATGTACTAEEINRSAFIAWIDCQL